MNFLETYIGEDFGSTIFYPYGLTTSDQSMKSLFDKVILKKYLNNKNDTSSNAILGRKLLNSTLLLPSFNKAIKESKDISIDFEKAKTIFTTVLNTISNHIDDNFKIDFSINGSIILSFSSNKELIELELFTDEEEDEDEIGAIMKIQSEYDENIKEFGKLDDILESLTTQLATQPKTYSSGIPDPSLAQTG